jgi:hypothetical protein
VDKGDSGQFQRQQGDCRKNSSPETFTYVQKLRREMQQYERPGEQP